MTNNQQMDHMKLEAPVKENQVKKTKRQPLEGGKALNIYVYF